MKGINTIIIALFCLTGILTAQTGHKITVKIDNFEKDTLLLAVHYGQSQFVQDTVIKNQDGVFIFEGPDTLKTGVYLVVLPPENNFFQILITEKEQFFEISTEKDHLVEKIKFKNSPENDLFYGYMNFLGEQSKRAEELKKELEGLAEDHPKKKEIESELEELDQRVKNYQLELVQKYPETFTGAIVNANISDPSPNYEGTEEKVQEMLWRYTQQHYFDRLDLGDPRFLRTPFLFNRVDYFINKLQVRHPDTLAKALELVLDKMLPAPETFKYYLIHYLNSFANSKFVGMDAVYVDLVEKYYATGKANWTDEEQLQKMVENAKELKPLLIGKIAPDITLQKKDGSTFRLHEVESPYTVLYFWRYDCGVCKKSTPYMQSFYEKYKDKGVKLIAVCMKYTDEIPECWKYVEENGVQDWLHGVDPYNRYKIGSIYSVKSTPQVYILDNKKEIISKRIAAEQMEEVMDQIIQMKKQQEEKHSEERN